MERRTGVEPATFSLARRRSTTELPPQFGQNFITREFDRQTVGILAAIRSSCYGLSAYQLVNYFSSFNGCLRNGVQDVFVDAQRLPRFFSKVAEFLHDGILTIL